MSTDTDAQAANSETTELVMKKDESTVHIWVVVNGDEVFHAAPHVSMSKRPVFAAVQTFYSRAFADHMPDVDTDEDSGLGRIFQ